MRRFDRQRRIRSGAVLREIVGHYNGRRRGSVNQLSPRSAYEAVTRQKVESVVTELREVKQRVNQLITLLLSAIALEILSRFVQLGP